MGYSRIPFVQAHVWFCRDADREGWLHRLRLVQVEGIHKYNEAFPAK